MSESPEKKSADPKRPRQGRSPAYPGISIQEALEKARALFDAEGKYAVPIPSAVRAWGYSEKSSGGREIRAAMRYFGLVTVEGDGDSGKVKLTEEALRVLLDEREDETEKKTIIRRLALNPAIHKKILEEFPDGIKSDATAVHYLMFSEGFNKTAAEELVAEFRATAAFAEIFKPATIVVKEADKPAVDDTKPKVEVGDLVQIVIGGAAQYKEPQRIRALQDHGGRPFAFIDGEISGIPMENIEFVKKGVVVPDHPQAPPVLPLLALDPIWREERLLDDRGEEILIRYKGEASPERYEFIRDYLDFKLQRLKPKA